LSMKFNLLKSLAPTTARLHHPLRTSQPILALFLDVIGERTNLNPYTVLRSLQRLSQLRPNLLTRFVSPHSNFHQSLLSRELFSFLLTLTTITPFVNKTLLISLETGSRLGMTLISFIWLRNGLRTFSISPLVRKVSFVTRFYRIPPLSVLSLSDKAHLLSCHAMVKLEVNLVTICCYNIRFNSKASIHNLNL
jgi:hypothetical protein